MAEEFNESSEFYRDHQQTWHSFVKYGMWGAVVAVGLTILAVALTIGVAG